METLITIKSIDIDEIKINKKNPTTERRTQISKDVAFKFSSFNGARRASINKDALKRVKPEIDTNDFTEYEENLSLEQIFKKLGKSNQIAKKYGYTNLDVPPEALEKAINESFEEPIKIIEEQQKEIDELKEENSKLSKESRAIKETIKEIEFPNSVMENNDEYLSLDEVDDNIKLVA